MKEFIGKLLGSKAGERNKQKMRPCILGRRQPFVRCPADSSCVVCEVAPKLSSGFIWYWIWNKTKFSLAGLSERSTFQECQEGYSSQPCECPCLRLTNGQVHFFAIAACRAFCYDDTHSLAAAVMSNVQQIGLGRFNHVG